MATPNTMHTTHYTWMRSLQITYERGRCLYAYSIEIIYSYELTLGNAHYHIILVSQYCNNFHACQLCEYFRIFTVQTFHNRQCNTSSNVVRSYSFTLNSLMVHPSVKTCMSLMLVTNCILLRAFVGCCINCTNIHGDK